MANSYASTMLRTIRLLEKPHTQPTLYALQLYVIDFYSILAYDSESKRLRRS